jgi:hypothetical protein
MIWEEVGGDEPDEEVGRGQERGLRRQEQYAVPPHETSRLQVVHLEHVRQTETVFLGVVVVVVVQQQSINQSIVTRSDFGLTNLGWAVAGVREARSDCNTSSPKNMGPSRPGLNSHDSARTEAVRMRA